MKLVCRPFIDLTCSFSFNQSEVKQLDVKWYFKVGFARHSPLHPPPSPLVGVKTRGFAPLTHPSRKKTMHAPAVDCQS